MLNSFNLTVAVLVSAALLQPSIVFAQDILSVNEVAVQVTVRVTGHRDGSGTIIERNEDIYTGRCSKTGYFG